LTFPHRLAVVGAALTIGLLELSSAGLAQTPPPKPQSPRPQSIETSDGKSSTGLFGAEPTGAARPTPRDSLGHPDLTGYWKPLREKGKPTGNIGRDLPGFKLPLTAAGEAALVYNRTKTIDPEALCILGGIPRHNASALPFEILQTPRRLAFLYLYSTHRFVPLDGHAHEDDPEPRFFGNPSGTWEGDTLVIDTVGIKDERIWADENADPQSDAMHVVERWTRPDAAHLHLEMIVDDPKFYTRKFTYTRNWVLGPAGEGLTEYSCAENNVDAQHIGPGPGAIGPNGERGADIPPKLPDNPPPPEFYDKPAASTPAPAPAP